MKESEIRPKELFNQYLELSNRDIVRLFSDKSKFVDVDCPACGCELRTKGLEKLGFIYVLCAECGTLYLSPRPTIEQLNTYYRDAESVKFWSTHFYKETEEARREKIFRPRAKAVGEWVAGFAQGMKATFVDIGSGYGIFLEEVRKLDIFRTLLGIEPNPEMAGICGKRGFPVVHKMLEDISEGEVQADFATAFEVLEHIFDPLSFLKAARRLLKPEGALMFTTLTASGFDISVLWEHSKSVYPPHHINLISVEGMKILVKRAGLKIVELSTPGQLDVDIVANMIKDNKEISVPRFISYMIGRCDEVVKRAFQDFLRENRLSSHVRVIAKAEGGR